MSNDQSGRKPGTFNNVPIAFNNPFDAVRGDHKAENFFVSNMGIRFIHYAALPDPLHENLNGDVRHSFDHAALQQFENDDRFHRENNFIYFKKGIVWGIFQGNSKNQTNAFAGVYADSGASVTLNRYYEDTEEKVKISEDDKLIPCELASEFFSVNWQKFHHNPTGIDRMQFKICEVEFLIDSDGVQYKTGVDFNLENGYIKWIDGANRPGTNQLTEMGKVCAIRYLYKPFFYVKTVIHDIRIRPGLDDDGSVTSKAGPLLVQLQADWVYLDERTADEKDVANQQQADDGDNTGPR